MRDMEWEIVGKLEGRGSGEEAVIKVLLSNRGLKTKKEQEEFFDPKDPRNLTLRELEIDESEMKKAVKRIKKARRSGESVIVFGDYDADGICATAVLWECLHGMGIDALPHIPERFSEGYGLSGESVKNLKKKNPDLGLIVTVDNGVVAFEAMDVAKREGIDVVVTDHHSVEKKLPEALAVVHTTKTSGSGIAWILARELGVFSGLELVAIGTVADQIPLLGVNRSLVKYGIGELKKTQRLGLLALFEQAGVEVGGASVYEINWVLAPRINAMGRLGQGIDSLRLLCTRRRNRADELSRVLNEMNMERQRIVKEALVYARDGVDEESAQSVIVLASENYHEGVIGLVASALVERYYRPAVVFSRGKKISKASARSIVGFDIIETVRKLGDYLVTGGGHPMAAGFSVETSKLDEFIEKLDEISRPLLTEEVLSRSLKIDLEVEFNLLSWELVEKLEEFEPTGLGNRKPVFVSRDVEIKEVRLIGKDGKHLKMRLFSGGREYGAVAFGMGSLMGKISEGDSVDVAYNFERNEWNGRESLQLKIKDIKFGQ